jgi:hypothetical protein
MTSGSREIADVLSSEFVHGNSMMHFDTPIREDVCRSSVDVVEHCISVLVSAAE